jgi:tetratricopeptide (TPR) repeat protein
MSGMLSGLLERFNDWRDRRLAFRDLRRQKSKDAPYEEQELGKLVNRIKVAAFCDRPEEGLAAWNALRARAPDLAITSTTAIRSMIHLKYYELVDTALAEAQTKFPGVESLAYMHAELSNRMSRWEEACLRWTLFRKRFPANSGGYTLGAIALGQLERYEEAGKLLESRVKTAPDDGMAAVEYARTAERLGNLPMAIERWKCMQDKIHDVTAWIGEAKLLVQLGKSEEALAVLGKARWKFQSSPLPSVEITLINQDRVGEEETLRQWEAIRNYFPAAPQAYIVAAWQLRNLGRLEEAEGILLRYVERDLGDSEPTVEYARFAHGRNWQESCRRWAIVRDKFPERAEGYILGADALDAVGQQEAAAALRARER